MGRASYTPEQKAAVMAALLSGQSVSQAAEQFTVPLGTVKRWSAEREPHPELDRTVKKEIGDLVLAYLRETLETLRVQQRVFRDETWLCKQPASELAVLHGVSADKAFRLLEAFKPDGTDDAGDAALETPAGAADGGISM